MSNDSPPLSPSSLPVTFCRGDFAVDIDLGIKICNSMSVKVIARENESVLFVSGTSSTLKFHSMPDGASIFQLYNDGYVYVSNSEMKVGLGGVYGLYFDEDGNDMDYRELLSNTIRNSGGGHTPWNFGVSCEEYGRGQCWQVGELK